MEKSRVWLAKCFVAWIAILACNFVNKFVLLPIIVDIGSCVIDAQLAVLAYWYFISKFGIVLRLSIWFIFVVPLFLIYVGPTFVTITTQIDQHWSPFEWSTLLMAESSLLLLAGPSLVLATVSRFFLDVFVVKKRIHWQISDLMYGTLIVAVLMSSIFFIQPYPNWFLEFCSTWISYFFAPRVLLLGFVHILHLVLMLVGIKLATNNGFSISTIIIFVAYFGCIVLLDLFESGIISASFEIVVLSIQALLAWGLIALIDWLGLSEEHTELVVGVGDGISRAP